MEHMPLISVIVPVYNVEAFLDKCISSIVNQIYTNMEIILVNDGSPDRSGAICDAWASKDSRIRVIQQENAGGGAARNTALDIAQGELIAFVDSDDYIAPEMFTQLNQHMIDGVDLVECGFVPVYDEEAAFVSQETSAQIYTVEEAMSEHIRDRFFRQLIWNKLYRRKILEGIRFPEGKGIDDEFFTYQAIGNAKKLVRIDAVLYAYRQQSRSVMHTLTPSQRLQAVKAKAGRHDFICQYMPRLQSLSGCSLWFTCLYQGQLALREQTAEQSKQTLVFLREIVKEKPMSPNDVSGKDRLWISLTKISLEMTCRLRNLLKIGL